MCLVDNDVLDRFSQTFYADTAAAGVPVTAVPLRNGKSGVLMADGARGP
jgi:hypothetical protein